VGVISFPVNPDCAVTAQNIYISGFVASGASSACCPPPENSGIRVIGKKGEKLILRHHGVDFTQLCARGQRKMPFRNLSHLEYTDEEKYDRVSPSYEPPDYPPGLSFSLSSDDLEKAEAHGGQPGDMLTFSAMGEVTSVFKGRDDCRIELQIGEFAGEDGKFFDLSEPSYISLCNAELEKMGLEADCERGDTIHLIGEARMESSSSTEHGGDRVTLQITHLAAEDESSESRDG
jgi:hypothetical protein